ncbi:MAG: peptidase S8 [Lutibacter sp.]|nr:MAG: peptidase S8 [Lutibacter sp.]
MLFFVFSVALFAQQNKDIKYINLEKAAPQSLQNAKQLIRENLKLSSDEKLVKTKTENDELGFTHIKYQQFFKGIKVEFGTYSVHAKNGSIKTMNGELYSTGKLNISPSLSKETAFQRAISHTGAEHYLWEYPDAAKEMDDYKKPEGELVILPAKVIGTEKAHLAYKFDIYATQPISRGYLYIDAHTGESLFFNAIIKHASTFGHIGEVNSSNKIIPENFLNSIMVSGSAQTRYSGTRSIETTLSGSNYILSDAGRKVYTRDALNQAPGNTYPYISNYSQFTDNDNNWTTAEHSANKDDAALDAHWGAMMTYDYFNNAHSRDSYDGNGAQIRSYVHVDNNYDNAFWNGSVMSYGDGSSNGNEGNGNFDALTSIDVAAHEIGHAICSNTADLAYQRESGGLNEGFSDIWGAAVEHFAKGNGNDLAPDASVWLIGDEIDRRSGSAGLRSMSNPNSLGQPDTYRGTNWVAATVAEGCITPSQQQNDYCGVHTNSGVLNHWFYLLTAGGTGTNDNSDSFNVTRIGMTKSAKIAYRTEANYLSANSTFADARTAAITSATDLYGAGSQEVISTTNAWYAVGVGAEYVQTCSLAAPSNFASSNIGDNGFTLTWSAVSSAASYDVTIGGNTTNVTGTSYTASGLTVGTSYACSIIAKCSTGGSGTAASTNVTTTGTAPVTYCDSASTNINDEFIGRVQLGTIDNSSGGQFYTDFTSISTNLVKGTSSTITVTPTWTGTVYSEGYSVWIDYNKDGDFTDSGEQVWTQTATKTTPVSGSFTVPSGATSGATRMRISMKYNGVPTSCETFQYGEVEDYTVNITNGVADTTAPVITLTGASTINLNAGDSYTDQGATATDNVDGNLTSSIVTTGAVNTATPGTYTINYNVSDAAGNAATQVSRTIIVTDNTSPIITLVGNANINLNVGDSYTDQGATATDNVDGNLTSNIVTTGSVNTAVANTYIINYNVSDAAGNNATQVSRTVIVSVPSDTTAPVITLTGASTINLNVGDSYTDQGATATDNVDGNLTSSIVTTGSVNTAVANTYTINYNVSDAAGNNATQVSRTVIVTAPSSGGCSGGITSFPYTEGYENTLGAWTQSTSDDINWTVDASGTPSSGTGPSSASQGTYYVYVEASGNNTGYPNKRAILNSPCYDLTSETEATFAFKYHMYGAADMGTIALEASSDNGSTWTSIWNESGNKGNSWQTASVSLASYIGGSVQLRFNRVTGATWKADIAIDDVSLTGATSGGGDTTVVLTMTFDNYPEETSWEIQDSSNTVVASGGTYASQADGSTLNVSVDLPTGCYSLVMKDVYGDGICCSYGNGSYSLNDNGTTLASGASFTSSETTSFCVGGATATTVATFGFDNSTVNNNAETKSIFEIFPNPVGDKLNISLHGLEAQQYQVFNSLGRVVLQGRYSSTVDVSRLPVGIYMIQLNIGEKTKVKRFIKK